MRYLVAIGIVLLLAVGLAGVKFMQISTLIAFGEAAAAAGPPPEAVTTSKATSSSWENELAAVGSVEPARGVTIRAEVPGVVSAIRFQSGAQVKAGQVLVELESRVERAQLDSLAARLELARSNAGRSRRLAEGDAATKAQLDADEAQVKTLVADVAALQAQIARKMIRAPFAGTTGIRQVNLGEYLSPGSAITVLESLGSVYVDFSVPQQDLGRIDVGTPVRVTLSSAVKAEPLAGKVAAIDPTVDEATRSARVRAEVPNASGQLRPGMFVNVSAILPKQEESVVTVPATAVVHAPYGDSVFLVEPKKGDDGKVVNGPDGKPALVARQQFVRLGASKGDFVAVTEGVEAGQEVVTAGAFKLRNGAPVMVNDSVKLNPSTNPNVENR